MFSDSKIELTIFDKLRSINYFLLFLICTIFFIGILALYSISEGNFSEWPIRHVQRFILGLIIFFIVAHIYWRTDKLKKTGYLFGLFFVLLWSSRFIVEFFKQAQVDGREDWILGMNTGQTLSIPFILIGLYLMFKKNAKS